MEYSEPIMAGEGTEGEADQEVVSVVEGEEVGDDKATYGDGTSERERIQMNHKRSRHSKPQSHRLTFGLRLLRGEALGIFFTPSTAMDRE